MKLTSCPCCGSRLLYPVLIWSGAGSTTTIVERRCPECEHRDSVTAAAADVRAWEAAQAQAAARLREALERGPIPSVPPRRSR